MESDKVNLNLSFDPGYFEPVREVLDEFKFGIKRDENLIESEAFVLVDIYWY